MRKQNLSIISPLSELTLFHMVIDLPSTQMPFRPSTLISVDFTFGDFYVSSYDVIF